jgi:SAM-dependent methyltransferase
LAELLPCGLTGVIPCLCRYTPIGRPHERDVRSTVPLVQTPDSTDYKLPLNCPSRPWDAINPQLGVHFLMNVGVIAKRLLPGFESRLLVRRMLNLPRDTYERVTGRRDPLIPPHGLWFVGGEENYQAVNEEFLDYFVKFGGLQPHHRVLDVGCGIGVMASRLTKFLSPKGAYFGFDIVPIGINWARRHISSRFPNFSFAHVDLFNKHYNPNGKLSADRFDFPYVDNSFDFVFLKSVFTHLLPGSIGHYLNEISRVLKPSGRCLLTVFLLNDESDRLIRDGESSIPLLHQLDGCRVLDPEFPETAVGISEVDLMQLCGKVGLQLLPPVHYGSWCGRKSAMSYQDILVLIPAKRKEDQC